MTLSREDLINKALNESVSIAFIYSPNELNKYIVEVVSEHDDRYIRKNNHTQYFLSVKDAVSNAQKYGAKEFFLCVDNTYDECGSTGAKQHFDYIPIHSKLKSFKN